MHKYIEEYPPALPTREQEAKELFPYKEMPPEAYAAKYAHKWGCFSFGEHIYIDDELNKWIHTLDDIFFTPGRITEIREKYLTKEEIATIEANEKEF